MAGSCNRTLQEAARDQGRADAGVHLAELPAECTTAFRAIAKGLGDNAVDLVRRYERVVIPAATRTLLRCSEIYLTQKRELEAR